MIRTDKSYRAGNPVSLFIVRIHQKPPFEGTNGTIYHHDETLSMSSKGEVVPFLSDAAGDYDHLGGPEETVSRVPHIPRARN